MGLSENLEISLSIILDDVMNIAPRSRFLTAAVMAAVMTATSFPVGTVQAGMISTKQIIAPVTAPDHDGPAAEGRLELSDRERVKAVLAGADVRAEMIALGVDPDEADARVASMTERELALVVGQLDRLPAGEGFDIGSILIILFIVFGITVILDALGVFNIYPFVCGPGECVGKQAALNPQQSAYPAAGPADPYYYQNEQASSYRSRRDDPYAQRQQPRYETEQYYQPAPVPPTRNYYEERYGTQRQIR